MSILPAPQFRLQSDSLLRSLLPQPRRLSTAPVSARSYPGQYFSLHMDRIVVVLNEENGLEAVAIPALCDTDIGAVHAGARILPQGQRSGHMGLRVLHGYG